MSHFPASLQRRPLMGDGAMGTMLHAAGNSLDRALPELNLSSPDLVRTIHDSYLAAGADVIQTNTFGANRLRLAVHGHGDRVADTNQAGVRIARAAAEAAGREVFVAGSVSPAVGAGQRHAIDPAERTGTIAEQVRALVEGGVDILVLETFGYLNELLEAITVCSELSDLPIVAQATFADDGHTLGGESPREVASALNEFPIAMMGANCTLGPQGILSVLGEFRRHTRLPLVAQPNAGYPRRVSRGGFEYNIDGTYFARYARRFVEAGARLVGGCCGTTPAHIEAAVSGVAAAGASPRRPAAARTQPDRPAAPPEPTGPSQPGFADRLAAREFVTAVEIAPPVGGMIDDATEMVRAVSERGVELLSVGPQESTRAQPSPINLAVHLQQQGATETITSATTWDKTIMTLQADLLGAHALGLRNVVCQTGNPPPRGDYPHLDGIWDVDSIGLIELLAGLNEGRDCNGLALATKTTFHIGAKCAPDAHDLEAELERCRLKVAAGARYLVTSPVYDPAALRRLVERLADEPVAVIACVAPLRDFAEAEYLAYEMPDISVPETTLTAMERAGQDGRREGLRLATELVAQARSLVSGIVFRVPRGDLSSLDELLAAL